jgi:glycosyltransferase involved in cell wall biosynthesis
MLLPPMRKVLVIITNPRQASYRLRIEALRAGLSARGVELQVQIRPRRSLARRRVLKWAGDFDSVILQRKLLDPSDARLLRRRQKKIFYDIDDAVMYHAHRVGIISQWRTRRRFEATARILDHVVAGNEYLAEMFRQRGRNVTILPTCVDPAHYGVKEHAHTDAIRLVWIGSGSTLPYLTDILPALRQIPNLQLITIADRTLENSGLKIAHIPWSIESESAALTHGDIGIAPTPDDRWTRGKCGFKIIQYMAAGLPVIASPVGANAQIVRQHETGFLATTTEQWIEAIRQLAADVGLRRQLGRTGRECVEREYAIDRAIQTWADLLSR